MSPSMETTFMPTSRVITVSYLDALGLERKEILPGSPFQRRGKKKLFGIRKLASQDSETVIPWHPGENGARGSQPTSMNADIPCASKGLLTAHRLSKGHMRSDSGERAGYLSATWCLEKHKQNRRFGTLGQPRIWDRT